MQDVLGLAILCYSFMGSKGFPPQDEANFKEALVDTLFNSPQVVLHVAKGIIANFTIVKPCYDWLPTVKSMLDEHYSLLTKAKEDNSNNSKKEKEKEGKDKEKEKEKENGTKGEQEREAETKEEKASIGGKSEEDIKYLRLQLRHSLNDLSDDIIDNLNNIRRKRESFKDYGYDLSLFLFRHTHTQRSLTRSLTWLARSLNVYY